jgi:DNA-binding NtrC family response regulator
MTPERILIVDDNLTNRRILSVSLAKAGYETREAVDGVEAIAISQMFSMRRPVLTPARRKMSPPGRAFTEAVTPSHTSFIFP